MSQPTSGAPGTAGGRAAPARRGRASAARGTGGVTIAVVAGVPVRVGPSWLLMAAVIAFTLGPVAARFSPGIGVVASYVVGLVFAVLLGASILLHELSHAVVARHFGMPVHSITLHFLGGVTQVGAESRTPGREFAVAVVGPLTSIGVGLAAVGAELLLRPEGTALLVLRGLAGVNLLIGVFNLVPGLPLDGGRLLRAAVWKATGDDDRGLLVAGWTGRAVAVLSLGVPLALLALGVLTLLDTVVGLVVAVFLWQGATAAVSVARWRTRMPALRVADLQRPSLVVPASTSLDRTLARARQGSYGAVVTTDPGGHPTGILSGDAVQATPEEGRRDLTAGDVSRRLEPGLRLAPDLGGMDLLRALQEFPATEYVVLDHGTVLGVVVTADVERTLRDASA